MILSSEYFEAKQQIQNNIIRLPLQAEDFKFFGVVIFGDDFPKLGEIKKTIQLMQILNDEYLDKFGTDNIADFSLVFFKGEEATKEKLEAFAYNHELIMQKEKAFVLTNKYVENVVNEIKRDAELKTDLYYVFDLEHNFVGELSGEDAMKKALSSKFFVFKKTIETTVNVPLINKSGRKINWVNLFLNNIMNENIDRLFFYNFVLGFPSVVIDDFFDGDEKYSDLRELLEYKYAKTDTQWAYYFQNDCSRKNLALPSIIREMESLKIEENIINTFLLYVIFDKRSGRKTIHNINLFEGASI